MLKFHILRFCVSIILHILFRSKFDFIKLSTSLIDSSLIEIMLLSQMNTFSRNFNHHWNCRDKKENFETILAIIFWSVTVT